MAKTMLWVGSDEASFITGEILTVDGAQSLTSNNFGDFQAQLDDYMKRA